MVPGDTLRDTFLHARYAVRLPGGQRIPLHPGMPLPLPVRAWMAGRSSRTWALVTAWNPSTVERDSRANRDAMRALRTALTLACPGARMLAAASSAMDGRWREAQLFVAGIPVGAAVALTRRYRQRALLAGTRHGCVHLLMLRPAA